MHSFGSIYTALIKFQKNQILIKFQISVIVHHSASDKLAVESFTLPACLGPNLIPFRERERVSGKVSNQRFVNSYVSGKLT